MYFEKISDTVKSLKLFENMFNVTYFTYFSQLSNSDKILKIYQELTKLQPAMHAISYTFLNHRALYIIKSLENNAYM